MNWIDNILEKARKLNNQKVILEDDEQQDISQKEEVEQSKEAEDVDSYLHKQHSTVEEIKKAFEIIKSAFDNGLCDDELFYKAYLSKELKLEELEKGTESNHLYKKKIEINGKRKYVYHVNTQKFINDKFKTTDSKQIANIIAGDEKEIELNLPFGIETISLIDLLSSYKNHIASIIYNTQHQKGKKFLQIKYDPKKDEWSYGNKHDFTPIKKANVGNLKQYTGMKLVNINFDKEFIPLKEKEYREYLEQEPLKEDNDENTIRNRNNENRSTSINKGLQPENITTTLSGKIESEEKQKTKKSSTSVIITNSEGKILFLRRIAEDEFMPLTYCLVGGGIDEGETPEQGALREAKEEVCLDLNYVELISIVDLPEITIYYFKSSNTQQEIVLDKEHQNYEWLSEEEWQEKDLICDLKQHLKELLYEEDIIEKGTKLNHKYICKEGDKYIYKDMQHQYSKISPSLVYSSDQVETIHTIVDNIRPIAFIAPLNNEMIKKINDNKLEFLTIEQSYNGHWSGRAAVIYKEKNKKNAIELKIYAEKHDGYLKDTNAEEARYVGNMLYYKDEDIDDFIKTHYPDNIEKSEKVEIDKEDFIKEHKKLVKVLRSKNKEDDEEEADDQEKELKEELEKGILPQTHKHLDFVTVQLNNGTMFKRKQLVLDKEIPKIKTDKYQINSETTKELEQLGVKVYGSALSIKTETFNNHFKGFDLHKYFSDIKDIFIREGIDPKKINMEVKFDIDQTIFLSASSGLLNNNKFTIERTLRRKNGKNIIYCNELSLHKTLQGKGIAKEILRSGYEQCKKAGIEKIELTADMTNQIPVNGGNTWSKFGFKCNIKEAYGIAFNIQENIGNKKQIGEKETYTITELDCERVKHLVKDFYTKYSEDTLFPVIEINKLLDKEASRACLQNCTWKAELNFNDTEAMSVYLKQIYDNVIYNA